MSYQVLARKYRPKSFATLVGQEHVVRALSHALDQQRLHHAYLFTGTRGVGKTTLSRILAKAFNCETGITSNPCGVCAACVAIDAGRFVDYIEMDAASNRGVDEMAALLEQAVYAPSNARFKVYMIDEVHMLTNHAFNSMLKTLEEPPEHVKFILATTDPQKIPVTVLSRCLQFNLKQMPPGHIVSHLEDILGQEQISFDIAALRLLAQGAHGSMRDALSLTDQAIAYAAGKVSLDAVQGMLGALDQSYLFRLLDALLLQDGQALLAVADEMAARSLSYKTALQDLASLLHQIAIAQLVPTAIAEELPERSELMRLAASFEPEQIQLFYQIVVHGRNELSLAPDEYAGFTMCLLRMLAFHPLDTNSVSAQGNRSSSGNNSGNGSGGANPKAPSGLQKVMSPVGMPSLPPARTAPPPAPPTPLTAETSAMVQPALAQPSIPQSASAPPASLPAGSSAGNPVRSGMSPAMAALARARAGNKAAASSEQASASSSVSALSNGAVAKSGPVLPSRQTQQPDSRGQDFAQALPEKHANPMPDFEQAMGMDDMPPPWDEALFEAPIKKNSSHEVADALPRNQPDADHASPAQHAHPSQSVSATEILTPAPSAHPPFETLTENEHAEQRTNVNGVTDVAKTHNVQSLQSQQEESLEQSIVLIPLEALQWDGHWPNLAAQLNLRAVAQQLAFQSELIQCEMQGNTALFTLQVPLATLLSSGSVEKLVSALTEHFSCPVRVETQIGAVRHTAHAYAELARAERQQLAHRAILEDAFVQNLIHEFGASLVTGSVKPL